MTNEYDIKISTKSRFPKTKAQKVMFLLQLFEVMEMEFDIILSDKTKQEMLDLIKDDNE